MSRCFCLNDNILLTINIRYNVILINIIDFNLIKTVHFRITNVRNLHSKVLCTLKITQQRFIKSLCLIKVKIHYSILQ